MSQKSSQRLLMATPTKTHSALCLGCWLYIWSCLLTIGVSQSISLMVSSSYNDEMQSETEETPHYDWNTSSAIQVEETTNSAEEILRISSTLISDGLLEPSEFSFSSDLSEVTHTISLPHEITAAFTRIAENPTQISYTNLYSTIESSNLSVYTEVQRSVTPFLPLHLNSSTTSPETQFSITTKPTILVSTSQLTYPVNSIFNISLPLTSINVVNSESPLSISLSNHLEPLLNNTKLSQSSNANLNTGSEKVSSNISQPLTTPFVAGKTHLKYENERYFLVLKSDDCPTFGASSVNAEILKTLSLLGILNVTEDITKVECQTTLNLNITATTSASAILKLKHISNLNLTVFIFNHSFQIVDVQQLELNFNKTDAKLTSNVISLVTQNIFKAYVAVGTCSGLVLVVCFMVYCFKCWTNRSRKRLGLRSNHSPLSPEDYTLTPIPRPTSLYVDYYRNSLTADLYSTTSAGSAGSVSPITETGVVQPFDTSIVPLEDSETNFQDSNPRRDSVEAAKADNVHQAQIVTVNGLIYCNSAADSTEKLNTNYPRQTKAAGVCNPTYQRY